MEELENNELVVEDSVPETLETNEEVEQVQTDASESEEQVQEEKVEPEKKYTQEEVDKLINARFAREKTKQERQNEKYKELQSIMQSALGANDLDEVIEKSKEFYKSNGIDIPEYKSSLNEKDEEILANAYANEIVSTGDYKEMEYEANRISQIPASKRSVRENVMFNKLCEALIDNKNRGELKEKGIDTNILDDQKFKDFKKKLNYNTPILEAVDMFNKINSSIESKKEKPASAGSAKNEVQKVDETFSAEKINSMTPQELLKYWNNPDFRKVAGLN